LDFAGAQAARRSKIVAIKQSPRIPHKKSKPRTYQFEMAGALSSHKHEKRRFRRLSVYFFDIAASRKNGSKPFYLAATASLTSA
jgi:hypothetical protein